MKSSPPATAIHRPTKPKRNSPNIGNRWRFFRRCKTKPRCWFHKMASSETCQGYSKSNLSSCGCLDSPIGRGSRNFHGWYEMRLDEMWIMKHVQNEQLISNACNTKMFDALWCTKKESTQKIAHVYSEASRLGALGDSWQVTEEPPIQAMRWTILLPKKRWSMVRQKLRNVDYMWYPSPFGTLVRT